MAYTKLYYHAIWSTKHREPTISPIIENKLHSYIAKKAIHLGGIVYAINGIDDHIHLAVSIPPSIAISKFIGQIKAVSSTKLNQSGLIDYKFRWQSSYSIFTFRESELPSIIRYVKNQKDHHANRTIKLLMEKI